MQYEEWCKRHDDLKYILLRYSVSLGGCLVAVQRAYHEAKDECIRLENT